MEPLAVLAVRAAMEQRAVPPTLVEDVVTTGDPEVMAAAGETEARVATPQK